MHFKHQTGCLRIGYNNTLIFLVISYKPIKAGELALFEFLLVGTVVGSPWSSMPLHLLLTWIMHFKFMGLIIFMEKFKEAKILLVYRVLFPPTYATIFLNRFYYGLKSLVASTKYLRCFNSNIGHWYYVPYLWQRNYYFNNMNKVAGMWWIIPSQSVTKIIIAFCKKKIYIYILYISIWCHASCTEALFNN